MLKLVSRFSGLAVGSTVAFLGIASLMPAIATAPSPPALGQARLGGQTVYVLNITRSGDRVLVRCYPGQVPRLTVEPKGRGVIEGSLACGS